MPYSATSVSASMEGIPKSVVKQLQAMEWFDPEWAEENETAEPAENLKQLLHDKDYITHEGLIDMAHQDGLCLTYTEPVVIPNDPESVEAQPTVFKAIVATKRGVFTAYGDAQQTDVSVGAVIRMAETRALSRALRQATNSGGAAYEEMPEADNVVVE